MNTLLFWLLGWIIFSVALFIYNVYIVKDTTVNKKVHAWRALWFGALSWVAIILSIAFIIALNAATFYDYIEEKLKKCNLFLINF